MSEYKDNYGVDETLGDTTLDTIEPVGVDSSKVEEPKMELPKMEMPKLDESFKLETPKIDELDEIVTSEVDELPKMKMPRIEVPPTPRVEPQVNMGQPRVEPRANIGQSRVELQQKVEPYIQPQQKVYDTYQFSQARQEAKKIPKASKKKSGTGKKFAMCIALALVFGLVSGVVFQGVNMISKQHFGGAMNENSTQLPETAVPAVGQTEVPSSTTQESRAAGNVAEVAANVMPSVVAISNISVQEVPNFFGSQEFESESNGSGIIVGQNDAELLIATNNHVVAGATTITVTFIDKGSVEAQIKGTDADNDLAVVAVNMKDISESTLNEIKVATIGDSDKLVVGEQVVAIGNALGYGQSVTAGYVSALDREVVVENVTANLIQTDAAINPGNSGGALLNMQGELIGINAVKFAANGVEGMGYAIPVSTAEPILGELMNRTTRFKVDANNASYLGVTCRAVTEETATMYNMPVGVFVAGVVEGLAAEKAGIQKGDIITKFDGTTIKTYNELVDALQYYEAGETVDVTVSRAEAGEYKEQVVSVVLDARPSDLDEQNQKGAIGEGNQEGSQLPW